MGLRRWCIAGVAAAAAVVAAAAPAHAASVNAQAKAKVLKPLTLTAIQDFDLGVLVLSRTWSGATVRLSRAGVLTCPANVTCSAARQVATYNLSGSNQQTVIINTPDVTLVNQSDSTKTLTMTVDGPGTVLLTNSGPPGTNFSLGGSITVNSTTVGGDYVGTFQVTAEYQ